MAQEETAHQETAHQETTHQATTHQTTNRLTPNKSIAVAVIGCGYWGPNLIRNFYFAAPCWVKYCCDLDSNRLNHIVGLYPTVKPTQDYKDILADPEIQAVAIATPVKYHFKLVQEALLAGKHVLVEKPITATVEEARALRDLSGETGRVLMVGHTFLYSPAVRKIKEVLKSGELGEILYIRTSRMSLGLFQRDINVIWDLAPHDVSILLYLLEKSPLSVRACGTAHVTKGVEDVSQVEVDFGGDLVAYLQLSWLDPVKVRNLTVVGDKKMLIYDDTAQTDPIRICDTGVKGPRYYDSFGDFAYSYWYGDTYIPRINNAEPLREEVNHFLECIESGREPLSGAQNGLDVVEILAAANASLAHGGQRVELMPDR